MLSFPSFTTTIWVPATLYFAMPFLAFGAASMIWLIPPDYMGWGCAVYLYVYAIWTWIKRWF